jgi:hypothetical protein
MSIRQYYRSRVRLNNQAFPVHPNGASLNWNRNHMIPFFAGNSWQINYIEGAQTPSVDVNFVLLDENTANCPIATTFLDRFMIRSNDFANDVYALADENSLFDAYLKATFPTGGVKANSFMISGSKGDDVRFNANFMIFSPTPGGAGSYIALDNNVAYNSNDYATFEGNPIRFQSLKFLVNGQCFNNVVNFQLTYSNNLIADLSMACGATPFTEDVSATNVLNPTYQNPLPVDMNASQPSCALSIAMQTQHADNIQTGDSFEIQVVQGNIATSFHCSRVVIDTQNSLAVGSGRQMRSLNCTVVGTSNSVPPLIVTSI